MFDWLKRKAKLVGVVSLNVGGVEVEAHLFSGVLTKHQRALIEESFRKRLA